MGKFFYLCFQIAIVLGIGRLIVLCGLAFWDRHKNSRRIPPEPNPEALPVSVLIPAYNEEVVIASTVERILASDYPGLEVIVIDDGSKDRTTEVLNNRFGDDPRVTILTIDNSGKATALNTGLARANGEIVVALDADTLFRRDTISRLARWFVDPAIGAVAGNAKVGNRINMITRWQALEYIVAQNLERRALAALDTLTVVPGAVGAWRRSVLVELGGFPLDTLAEDQDLTIAVQRAGHSVLFDSSAIARTEAPASFRGLARQRFRWAYGTLQCLWKYRDVTFNPKYGALGMIALPQVWLFQIALSALAPPRGLLVSLAGADSADELPAARRGVQSGKRPESRDLLWHFRRGRSLGRGCRFPDGKARAVEPAVVADAAAIRLSPADVLCRRALDIRGAARAVGRLGEA
ncbi:MAG: glycosyltransferase family 2 protein [Rhizomicrobium sp.]